MKIFGKKVGKAIQIPPIIKRMKNWAKRVPGIGKPRSLAKPLTGSAVGEDDFGLSIPMPGCGTDNVKLELQGNTLIISGEKERSREVKEGYGVHREFLRSTFHKTLELPGDVAPDSIHATLGNGFSSIVSPKGKPPTGAC